MVHAISDQFQIKAYHLDSDAVVVVAVVVVGAAFVPVNINSVAAVFVAGVVVDVLPGGAVCLDDAMAVDASNGVVVTGVV